MDFVNSIIQNNSIVVFSKKHCYKCDQLKEFLKLENVYFYNYVIDEMEDDEQIFDIIDTLKSLTNFSQYPVCFIDKEYISSFSEIKMKCVISKGVDIDSI